MAKCKDSQESGGGGGCPDYMLTYGDMMSLLLCFFVIIVSLSKIKEDEQFRMAMESLRKAFGYSSSRSPAPGDFADTEPASLVERIQEEISRRSKKGSAKGKTKSEKSQIGKATTVRNIRDGLMITVGGLSLFGEGEATLLPEAREELAGVAKLIKGYRNKVQVRGHTSRAPLPQGSPFKNHMALSYARASAVVQCLVDNEVSEDRLNIEACGGHEPVKVFAYDDEGQANNRRVEIVVKDAMVEDYEGDAPKDGSGG